MTEKLKSLCSQEDLKSWIPLPPIKKIGTQNVLDQESIEIVGEESKKSSNSSKLSLCFSGSDNGSVSSRNSVQSNIICISVGSVDNVISSNESENLIEWCIVDRIGINQSESFEKEYQAIGS